MKKSLFYVIGVAVCIMSATSCTTTKSGGAAKKAETKSLTFNGSIKELIAEKCGGCHTGGRKGNFALYSDVKAKIANGSFAHAVFEEKSMPPREPLSASDFATLKKWVDAGAPEN